MKRSLTKFLALLGVFLFLGAGNAWGQITDVVLAGELPESNWQADDNNYKMYHADGDFSSFIICVTFPVGTHDFKIIEKSNNGDTWYGYSKYNNGNVYDGSGSGKNLYNEGGDDLRINVTGSPKTYKFEYYPNGHWLTVTELPDLYIAYTSNGTTFSASNGTKFTNLSSGIYALVTTVRTGEQFKILDFKNNSNDIINYGGSSSNLTFGNKTKANLQWNGSTIRFASELANKQVLVLFNRETGRFIVEELPTTLNLVGNLRSGNWDLNNMEALNYSDGVFKIINTEIVKASQDNPYGYFSFCENIISNPNASEKDRYDQISPRFGSLYNGYELSVNNSGVLTTDLYAISNDRSDAYKVAPGNYDITVDIPNLKLSISKNLEIAFDWHSVKGIAITNSTHKGKTSDPITLKVGTNTSHEAIALANITVVRQSSKQNKRRASSTDDYEIDENNVITFKTPGTYNITAELPEGTAGYHTTAPISLTAVVTKDITTAAGEDISKAFVTSGTTTLDDVFFLSESGLVQGVDFNISFAPKSTGWADGSTVIANALGEDVYAQYQTVLNQTDDNIDGIYKEITDQEASSGTEDNNTFGYNVTATFPCSGVYVMTVSPVEGSDYTFEEFTVDVTIIPNLQTMFGSSCGFYVNGTGFDEGDPQTIEYQKTDNVADILAKAVIYKPGTYFDSSFSVSINGQTINGVRSESDKNTSWIPVDLSSAAETPITIVATIVKNGAVGTYTFNFSTGTTPTAVEAIGADEGEAVYYNLQGVRVDNPEHGIYVKVVNGKASKVVL